MKKLSFFIALLLAVILALDIKLPILAETQNPSSPDTSKLIPAGNPWVEGTKLSVADETELYQGVKPEPPTGSQPIVRQIAGEVSLLPIDNTLQISTATLVDVEQLILNGGFEDDDSSWTTYNAARTTAEAASGSWSMGSYGAIDGYFYQPVTFPSDVISAILEYSWKNDPPDPDGTTGCYDYQQFRVFDDDPENPLVYGPAYCALDTEWYHLTLDFSPVITDVRGLTLNVAFHDFQDNWEPDAIFYFDDISLNVTTPSTGPATTPMDVCVPADTPPFAYINQPWDWVEGMAAPESQVDATLSRSGGAIATASTTAGPDGWFSFDFMNSGVHVDIIPGDEVMLNGGGFNETITIVDIVGWIDVLGDSVGGIASGSTFDVWGDVCVRSPFDPWFASKEVYFDTEGRFDVNFSGIEDIDYDYIAQVVYPDPNDNYVVQVFYPEGLDLNVLIGEDRIEGVTTPGEEVSVLVWNDVGGKGSAVATADETGFYSTVILDNGNKVDIQLGDHVGVSNAGHAREAFITLSHESWLKPWIKRVEGKVQGVDLTPSGRQGKVDLWSLQEGRWYSQYVWIESDGSYGADFNEIVEMTSVDRIRLWVSDGDGFQQAAFGSNLELGVKQGDAEVWGHTIADSIVSIILYRSLDTEGNPIDILGEGGARVDPSGNFATTIMRGGEPVGITPGNIVEAEVSFEYSAENDEVETIEFSKLFFIGNVSLSGDSEQDILTIFGPANANAHIEGFRRGTTSSDSYFWTQDNLGADGQVQLNLASEDLQSEDIFKVIAYMGSDGAAVELVRALSSSEGSIFLPLITR